jgi:hypothetical protein
MRCEMQLRDLKYDYSDGTIERYYWVNVGM